MRRVFHNRSAAPLAIQRHIVEHFLVRVRVAKANIVSASVRILAQQANHVQTDFVRVQVGVQMRWRCIVEIVKIKGKMFVRQGATQLVGLHRSKNLLILDGCILGN